MKKNPSFSMTVAFLSILPFLSGCKKLFDYLDQGNHSPCQIGRFSYTMNPDVGARGRDTLTFAYNAAGNPITGIRPRPGTSIPNFVFRYDRQQRLTDLIGAYRINTIPDGDDDVESWEHFIYDRWNRIILDSAYSFPVIKNGRPTLGPHISLTILTFEYDAENRITAVHENAENGGFIRDFTYAYDRNGNLKGPASYDEKVNLHQTNKIWMFLDRDYSKNNPLPAAYKYSSYGLPEKITLPSEAPKRFFFTTQGNNTPTYTEADIEYSCN